MTRDILTEYKADGKSGGRDPAGSYNWLAALTRVVEYWILFSLYYNYHIFQINQQENGRL